MRALLVFATVTLLCGTAGAALASSATTTRDILDRPVTLGSEADLVRAVSATLQHALVTSERYRGRQARVQRFARLEVKQRRQQLQTLQKRAGVEPPAITSLAIAPSSDRLYVQAMLRNHARLLELLEFGRGLELAPDIRRLMTSLTLATLSEFAALSALAQTRTLASASGVVALTQAEA